MCELLCAINADLNIRYCLVALGKPLLQLNISIITAVFFLKLTKSK